MQLAVGRRWVLEFRVNVALRERVDDACTAVQTCIQRSVSRRERALRWERDKYTAVMLSGWDRRL
jgi:hypothetical protein